MNWNAKVFEWECAYRTAKDFFIIILAFFCLPKAKKFALMEIDFQTGELLKKA
jgi:hypothetical protein